MSNFGENTGANVTHTGAGEYGSEGKTGTGAYGTKNSSECETGNKGHGQGTKNGSECETGNKGHGQDCGSKLPGGNKPTTTGQDAYGHGAATTPGEGYGAHGTETGKKGIVEKIKEKLPGGQPSSNWIEGH